MKRFVIPCAFAMACALWISYAAEQQVKQTDYFQRLAEKK